MRILFALFAATLLLVTGCVSSSTFDEQVLKSNQLSMEVAELNEQLAESEQQKMSLQQNLDEANRTIESLDLHTRNLAAEVEQERLAREATVSKMKTAYGQLQQQMQKEIQRGEITISELQGRLTVNKVDSILFSSGSAKVKEEGLKVIQRVGDIVKGVNDKDIQVEGHTDNIPISSRLKNRFPSNWELSTARAVAVVQILLDMGIEGERLSAAGYGEFRPIADNATREGRAQNRRIQIVLVPQLQRDSEAAE